jgi:NADH-quinone oxidoreductase subunit C
MTPQEIHARLHGRFGDAVGPLAETRKDPFFTVRKEVLVELARFAKAEPDLALDALEDLTALDWPQRNVIEVVLHLFSFRHHHGVTLKVEADRAAPSLPDDWEGHPLRKDYREAGGWHGIGNERENPLVELRRLDDKRREENWP